MREKSMFGLNVNIPVCIFREDKHFVAYSPALDLSTSGKSYGEVRERFNEIVEIFFEEIIEKNTLNEVLQDLGWTCAHKTWTPPAVISQEYQKVKLPV